MSRIRFVVFAFFVAALAWTGRARAQSVDIRAAVDSDTVEVGDTFIYTLNVSVRGTGEQATDPQPGAHAGFDVLGTSSAPVHMNMNFNGQRSSVDNLTTTWTLRATRTGQFTLGPASAQVGAARRSAGAVRVTVVPRGKAPRRPRSNNPFDPFGGGSGTGSPLDPWKGLFDFGDDDRHPQALEMTADPKLALAEPRAPIAFLHAAVDKTRAVVGEQVTLAVYLYQDPYARAGQPADVHEATATDFAKRSLLDSEMRAIPLGNAMVGGRPWSVSIVRKDALFPLKAGHLMIEPMSLSLPQARAGKRESERLAVDIGEPPREGRPAGYALGDVGDMALSATVSPRTLEQGGAVGVTIELRGTGNLPAQLALPVQQGVDWLDAQTRDDLKAVSSDRFGGTRTFSYVVRVHKAGAIDLGEVRLPFWDPDRKTYNIARAALGVLDVAKGNEHVAAPDEKEQVLPGLPKPRMTLEGQKAESYLAERPVYWGLLFGSPLACVFAIGAHGAARRLREKRAAAAPSPERVAKERRAEADAAAKGDDAKAAMGAIARAIESGVLAKTGVNVRGGDGATIARELEDAGVSAERTKAVVELLRTCEDARFSPDGVTTTHARETWKRAEETLDDLAPEKKA